MQLDGMSSHALRRSAIVELRLKSGRSAVRPAPDYPGLTERRKHVLRSAARAIDSGFQPYTPLKELLPIRERISALEYRSTSPSTTPVPADVRAG